MNSKGSDQVVRMRMFVWAFAGYIFDTHKKLHAEKVAILHARPAYSWCDKEF